MPKLLRCCGSQATNRNKGQFNHYSLFKFVHHKQIACSRHDIFTEKKVVGFEPTVTDLQSAALPNLAILSFGAQSRWWNHAPVFERRIAYARKAKSKLPMQELNLPVASQRTNFWQTKHKGVNVLRLFFALCHHRFADLRSIPCSRPPKRPLYVCKDCAVLRQIIKKQQRYSDGDEIKLFV